jgi:hypothetical protein
MTLNVHEFLLFSSYPVNGSEARSVATAIHARTHLNGGAAADASVLDAATQKRG